MKRYLPSAVIFGVIMWLAACVAPPPPITPHPPPVFRVPSVVPTQICEHFLVKGWRFETVVPERGLWNYAWLLNGVWVQSTPPYWHEVGDILRVETTAPFHIIWTPQAAPNAVFQVVSPDVTPVETFEQICPDY